MSPINPYNELALQRLMVSDRPRTEAFAAAILEVVKDDQRVIDVGAGTGLLAMLAANAGAEKVYALEQQEEIHRVAAALVAHNELSDVVEVLHHDASAFKLKQPVDVIVSEWLGHFAFTEGMLQKVLACRDHNLKPGGQMLPAGVDVLLAPLDSWQLYAEDGPGFWDIEIGDIDFSSLEAAEVAQGIAIKTMVQPEELLAPGQSVVSLDLATATEKDMWPSGELHFCCERDGDLHGFCGWFVARLSASIYLDTGPDAPLTHWRQTYFPMRPRAVAKGEEIAVRYTLSQHHLDPTCVEVALKVGEDAAMTFRVS